MTGFSPGELALLLDAERIDRESGRADDPAYARTVYGSGGQPDGAGPAERVLIAETFSAIRTERTRWLWRGRIPLGTATLLVGREKLGKSTLTTELAARLSRGRLAGDLKGHPASTLIVSYEDQGRRHNQAAAARRGRRRRTRASGPSPAR